MYSLLFPMTKMLRSATTSIRLSISLRRFRTIIFCLVLNFTLANAWEKKKTTHGKSIIAYYASWQMYDREGLAKPANLDHSKVTRYNFAFFQTNEKGDIWGTDAYADSISLNGEINWNWFPGQPHTYCSMHKPGEPPACVGHKYETGLIYQAHKAGVEVYISIGGWTLSNHFPVMAKNPAARKNFAFHCVLLIEVYDVDGIDIDWEYPGYADHMGTPEDTRNYSLLLKDIRDALDVLGKRKGRIYGLTAALPCGPDLIDNIEISTVSSILTELNLMTYDFYGAWDKKTGPNAPLYDMNGGTPGFSVHSCVENWKAGGGRPDQINIGLPFYGRSFLGSPGTVLSSFGQANDGTADIITWRDDEGSPQYYNIANQLSTFTSFRDEQTKTQYAYNNFGFVSYDDEQAICDKTEYAIDHNLRGYIIWEISGDLMPDLSTPLLDITNLRLNRLDVRCDPSVQTETVSPTQTPTAQVTTSKPTESIITPKKEDILFGRGSGGRGNPGNIRFRGVLNEYLPIYKQSEDKNSISESIVNIFLEGNPPSRFLRLNQQTLLWEIIDATRAKMRVSQMLRSMAFGANAGGVAANNTSL